jgi:NAD+ synthase (glutamine-hydrolysing)
VNINGSPYRRGVVELRNRMLATRAADHVVTLAYVNTVGGQDELVFDGASAVFNTYGNLIASGPSFIEELLVIDLDMEAVARQRQHDKRVRTLPAPPLAYTNPEIVISGQQAATRDPIAPTLSPPISETEEVYRALVLGTRDYVRKNGFEEVFIAISGGIDSALTAAVAVDALGADAVTGVVMSSKYSSEHSRADAFDLAKRLGIATLDIPIEAPHEAFDGALRPHITGLPGSDVAEQNIQARIRGVYMMALANARPRAIVLTTGNKSELATGYATLYGDMAGGFAVLKDVPKLLVYKLSEWRNASGFTTGDARSAAPSEVSEVIPTSTITKPPSAELKPDQVDQDSLPPYEVLDPILEAYVEQDRSIDEIAGLGYDRELVGRVIRMVDRTEYKRRQSPPGPKVTTKAFGRDRRLPITNRFTES